MGKKSVFSQEIPFGEDDCDRPACADTISMLKSAMARTKESAIKSEEIHTGNKKKSIKEQPSKKELPELECPPGKEMIGNSTWTLVSWNKFSIIIILCLIIDVL